MSFDVDDQLQQVVVRLGRMDAPGHCPGYSDVMHNGLEVNAQSSAHAASSAAVPLYTVVPPTDEELFEALSMSHGLDFSNNQDCFRVLVCQNSVILRDTLHRRALCNQSAQSRGSTPMSTSSACSTVSSSGSAGSGLAFASEEGVVSAAGTVVIAVPSNIAKLCPPKNFQCPICLGWMNEKDFDRHVKGWLVKSRSSSQRKMPCLGIRNINHPFLRHYPISSLPQMVGWLVADIRSLVHPGAYDTMQPGGSGRHLIVAQRFARLLQAPNAEHQSQLALFAD